MADPYSVNGKTAGMIVGIWLVLFHMVLDVLNQKDQEFIPEFRNSKIGFRIGGIFHSEIIATRGTLPALPGIQNC